MPRFSGLRLRELRQAQNIRAERLALTIGRSVYTVHDYELNRSDPPASIVAKLADALGCSPGDLFADDSVAAA